MVLKKGVPTSGRLVHKRRRLVTGEGNWLEENLQNQLQGPWIARKHS